MMFVSVIFVAGIVGFVFVAVAAPVGTVNFLTLNYTRN